MLEIEKKKDFIPIPLPDNTQTGWSCGEVAVVAALKYFNAQPRLDEEEARELTKKIPGYNTWPEQLVRIASAYPEVHAKIYRTKPFTIPAAEYVRESYDDISAKRLLEETDIDDLEVAIKECKKNKQYVIKDISLETILAEVKPGAVVIVWVCYDTLYKESVQEGFNAHYVIITRSDPDHVYVHECGGLHKAPEANKPITRQRFAQALGPDPNFMVWCDVI